ncbi:MULTISPECIES: YopT-type cysteine protease domain-containing protein [Bradyrhizobium]|uniref:YopT-type cysteine protease-like protein n=1 Tax=Bradyrhizobium ottawaense TaxID=931866 RepID=A0ABV4FIN1_9BRAD|nr:MULTISPECIES: YopT-type cysteine protease domain-containing protein [Bradyrhizobium]MBP2435264.1 YopT-type cysteine protease-like protein [Bradyrhizobium elkanii]MCP1737574.1 YopT-type cysteine protease-like protein [Bradyrhizobium elkanii]MCS3576131.1 YopT-type cysteine protease-like protein [Bradyrhizobium elkanii]MCS3594534.1 YopT-type cysteine protease-like protein [Bradyrhizobium elkanii]MCS3626123.1 YopT-type cysteine protease-like protein [Bradyrhizobium elkanii]
MYNRISDSSTGASQPYEPSQSVNSDSFKEKLADLALQMDLPHGDLPDEMGCCASKPYASDPATPSASSPARPSTSLFQYRTAELPQANADNICVGLTAGWLSNLPNSPRSRMNALVPGSDGHHSAARLQEQYEELLKSSRNEGAESSDANFKAKATVLKDGAGLEASKKGNTYTFGDPTSFSSMLHKITDDGSKYLLSLGFAERARHSVATSASNGSTTLFDPNYGEFTVPSGEMGALFESLANRYRNPNGLHLSTITTQKIR